MSVLLCEVRSAAGCYCTSPIGGCVGVASPTGSCLETDSPRTHSLAPLPSGTSAELRRCAHWTEAD
ncbi:hypothetical protein C8Q80DRAFT_1273342 [Daedaleopsis nitida]|nr:hypothetical protein C8Q80DRAFT_1273342 [Daedaleopsis nitida]